MLSLVPRPVLGLIAIIPLTASWKADRVAEDTRLASITDEKNENNEKGDEEGKGEGSKKDDGEEIVWFKQTIGNACGSYALIHTVLNGPAKDKVLPGSTLSKILAQSTSPEFKDASTQERAKILYNNQELEVAHQEAAQLGDSETPVCPFPSTFPCFALFSGCQKFMREVFFSCVD